MITIQSAMLVALGFLAATLFALVVAPAFWSRAVRLTTRRIKDSMPLSEIEIRADKDRIRAEYAIKVHKLESQVDSVKLAAARQNIEINRRDAVVNELEGELDRLKASHEETQNARRVLEQTVADRLPRVEHRLTEAKKLLLTRDREVGELTRTADRQSKALAEATAINAQQQTDVERLTTSLASRVARNQDGPSDARFDGEVALRSEIEALRGKTREQAQLLARLQSLAGRPSGLKSIDGGAGGAAAHFEAANGAANGGAPGASVQIQSQQQAEIERQLRTLKARNEDQAAEIARLKAALTVFEAEAEPEGKLSLRESRIGVKARVQSLEAQTVQQTDTIQKLRSELAAANERLARQAAHFTNELKRLGAGTLPASGQARRAAVPQRSSLADRVSQARASVAGAPASNVEALPAAGKSNGARNGPSEPGPEPLGAPAGTANGAAGATKHVDAEPAAATAAATDTAGAEAGKTGEPERRPRLLDRISNLARSP